MKMRFEDPVGDFPFYKGLPSRISAGQWLFVLAMVVVGFLSIALPIPGFGGTWGQFIPALLLPGLPLAALAFVAPNSWRAIFGKVSRREIQLMFGFAALNILVTLSIGVILQAFTEVASNSATSQLGSLDTAGRIAFFAKTIPQLLGEEVITILPFLAALQLFSKGFGLNRQAAIVGTWLLTALMFGLIHLPTYGWNVVQCIAVIGSARLVLTLAWIKTKNLWVSTGAHIVNDWLLFLVALLGSSLVVKT